MAVVERYDPFDGKLGFALATRLGEIVYASGMTGINFEDQQVPEGLEAQLRLAYQNVDAILQQFDSSLEFSIEQVVFFVGDRLEASTIYDAVRRDVFGASPPSSTMVIRSGSRSTKTGTRNDIVFLSANKFTATTEPILIPLNSTGSPGERPRTEPLK